MVKKEENVEKDVPQHVDKGGNISWQKRKHLSIQDSRHR